MSHSLRPHESHHARAPCPSPTPWVHPNSCAWSQWCHPAISSSVLHFSSCPQSLPASRSFPMSQLFTWGGQTTGVSASASVLPMNTQNWPPLGWTGWTSLQSNLDVPKNTYLVNLLPCLQKSWKATPTEIDVFQSPSLCANHTASGTRPPINNNSRAYSTVHTSERFCSLTALATLECCRGIRRKGCSVSRWKKMD